MRLPTRGTLRSIGGAAREGAWRRLASPSLLLLLVLVWASCGSSHDPGGGGGGAGGGIVGPPVLDNGRVALRRLNAVEYDNTVRDLLGTVKTPADNFPPDEVADGFDTVGQFLAFTMERAQSVEESATELVDELMALAPTDPRRARVLVCALEAGTEIACARRILSGFVRRAWRRAVTVTEVDELAQVIDEAVAAGGTYDEGLRAALTLVLISPHFLYRIEKSAVDVPAVAAAQPVSDYELASRLSYFLWSSMPDEDLLAAAEAGTLVPQIPSQLARMLDDPKASALTSDFAGQWLSTRTVTRFVADPTTFPGFSLDLPQAASQETQAFFTALVKEDLPVNTLLLADFTFANALLGQNYGIAVDGDALVRTSLVGTPRSGVLTQSSFLMTTSLPYRTSPVKRGAWVLDRLLCSPPSPPPPNLMIPDLMVPPPGSTLREVLEAHRANPVCGGCHNAMDPIGLGLENFDAIGQYRTMDNGAPVDARGMLPGGETFSGAKELAALLAKDPRFAACTMQKLLTFAVGRPFSQGDAKAYATALAQQATSLGKATWRAWIETAVGSEAFRTRRSGVNP